MDSTLQLKDRIDQNNEIFKKKNYIDCLQETHFKYKDRDRLEVNEWRRLYHVNKA